MVAQLEYARPELFDEAVDWHHRSYVSVVLGRLLDTIHCWTTRTLIPIHQQWILKYVIHIYRYFCFSAIVIVLSALIFFQATRYRNSPCCAVGRGGQATS
jgi:hypothetical protein